MTIRCFARLIALMSLTMTLNAQPVEMLIRADDMGMSHGQNEAFRQLIGSGLPVSVSVMWGCPWWKHAVEILRTHDNPNVSVGVHLTLNAEWRDYRWGPILGASAVPSLVDADGYFFPSRSALFGNNPRLEEIEAELRAQIQRAVNSGIRIDYVDYHMGAAVQTAETRAIVEKLAAEFGLADMARHRHEELQALLSDEFKEAVASRGIRLVTYRDLVRERGLQTMTKPSYYP